MRTRRGLRTWFMDTRGHTSQWAELRGVASLEAGSLWHSDLVMRLLSHYDLRCPIVREAPMALSTTEMDRKIDEHFGFEARDNIEGVLATLTTDVEHDIV